jgi:hypothetical protein
VDGLAVQLKGVMSIKSLNSLIFLTLHFFMQVMELSGTMASLCRKACGFRQGTKQSNRRSVYSTCAMKRKLP